MTAEQLVWSKIGNRSDMDPISYPRLRILDYSRKAETVEEFPSRRTPPTPKATTLPQKPDQRRQLPQLRIGYGDIAPFTSPCDCPSRGGSGIDGGNQAN